MKDMANVYCIGLAASLQYDQDGKISIDIRMVPETVSGMRVGRINTVLTESEIREMDIEPDTKYTH
jgi:hypothetical protein